MALKVGLILYSVNDEMKKDPLGTVEKVGKLGYRFIETCNHAAETDSGCGFGIPAEMLKETFDRYGTKVVSAHVSPLDKADIEAITSYNHVLGNTNIVRPSWRFETYDDVMRGCEEFNREGRTLAERGMRFLYHNHNREFCTVHGKTVMDLFVENTDPEYVSFELDTFWTMRGGVDPVEVMKHMGNRIALIHQKDFAWDSVQEINLLGIAPEERKLSRHPALMPSAMTEEWRQKRKSCYAEIGCGIMPIQKIIDAAVEYTKAEYLILEQDATRMPTQLGSIAKSMEGLKTYTGIEW